MKTLILLSCLFSLSFANDRPVIGVLALELASSPVLRDTYGQSYSSYLPASYVKWIESGGARVMPIKIGQNSNYYRSIMSKINGVLLPGGAADINIQNGYSKMC
jgi:gamma-glutamyl hydrolase